MTTRTGYDLREGSQILATRRAEQERCEAVAEAMIRRAEIQRFWRQFGSSRLAREALRILDAA